MSELFSLIHTAAVDTQLMVLLYIYMAECAFCRCLCVCVILNQSTSKKPHFLSDLSKLDTFLNKTYSKVLLVLRHQGSTYVDA